MDNKEQLFGSSTTLKSEAKAMRWEQASAHYAILERTFRDEIEAAWNSKYPGGDPHATGASTSIGSISIEETGGSYGQQEMEQLPEWELPWEQGESVLPGQMSSWEEWEALLDSEQGYN